MKILILAMTLCACGRFESVVSKKTAVTTVPVTPTPTPEPTAPVEPDEDDPAQSDDPSQNEEQ